jgi:hypothetical protein
MLRDGSNVFCWGTSPPELTIGQEQCRWKNPVRNSTGLNSPLSFFVAQPPADFGFQLLWLCYDWFHFHFWIWFIANDPPPDTKKPRMAQPRYQPLMQLPSLLAQPPQQQLLWTRGQLSSLDHWGYFSVGSIYSNSRRLELWAGRFIRSDLFMYNNNIYIYILPKICIPGMTTIWEPRLWSILNHWSSAPRHQVWKSWSKHLRHQKRKPPYWESNWSDWQAQWRNISPYQARAKPESNRLRITKNLQLRKTS